MSKRVYKSLDQRQNEWLSTILRQRSWRQTDEFKKYVYQFTEDVCDRTTIPYLVRKSFVNPIESFNPYRHEGHDIAQRILTHLIENKSLDYERTFSIDTTVYIINRLFRMHQDVVELVWIELTTPHTKNHKMDGLFKVIKTKQSQAVILFEFSYGRRAPESKEDGDEVKLCRNSMRILNNLLQNVPKNIARVYLVQSANGLIKIKYLVRPLPSIYILQTFTVIKIPVSFDDFEQSAKIMVDLMNLQADVLSTIKAMNKVVIRPNYINITSVHNTPEKNKKVEQPSPPKSPCPGESPLELPSLTFKSY
ncbi:1309_t:CDS:2 [Dentiscutata erythropus]|uniref:1309_t:CDS:1 n=1 Tax=Dentiscutata erythropus TaxID=1348616 RepID=A0A9N9F855_9GLOM|nr:1309_t:CDS:2 [Dentiscutata erythropus]